MSDKALAFLISGTVFLLLGLPGLYFGLCLSVWLKSIFYMPLPTMICIVISSILFHKAENK